MRFGVFCFNWEPFSYDVRTYERLVIRAEELGYDSFLVSDHFLRPLLGTSRQNLTRHSTHEAWSLLSYVAAKTSRIRIGTCVTPLPMRNPLILAKVVTTLDHLSNGRVILRIGAGYDKNELATYGRGTHSNSERVDLTTEAVRLIKRLWTDDFTNFAGDYFKVARAVLEPKPVQKPHPPIWSGAMHDRMISMTAKYCDCWMPARSMGAGLDGLISVTLP